MPDELDTDVRASERSAANVGPEPESAPESEPGSEGGPTTATTSGRGQGGAWPVRVGRTVRRVVRHEWTLACLGGLALAGMITWPTLAHPFSTLPGDLGDPTLQAWQVAWTGHALLHHPLQLWDGNGFYPEKLTLAYSDSLLGYAPAGFFGGGFEWAVFRYNVLFVLAHALAFIGAYFLVRQLGSGRLGGVVAGLAFGFAPWRVAHSGHLNVLSTGGIALSLAMLARGHDWKLYRPGATDSEGGAVERHFRPGWALAGWLMAAWQISLGFGLGVPFGYFLGGVCLVAAAGYGLSWAARRRRPPFPRRLLVMDLVGGGLFGLVTALMGLPYLRLVQYMPDAPRSVDNVKQFSVPFLGLFTAPDKMWLWGETDAAARDRLGGSPEMFLLPGLFLIGLAIAGTYYSVWRPHQRLLLGAGVVVSVILSMGAKFFDGDPGYLTLYRLLPGWDAMRTPGRLVVWTTLLLAVLAAGFLTALTRKSHELRSAEPTGRPRSRPARRAAAFGLLGVATLLVVPVLAESINKTDNPDVWTPPPAMHDLAAPILVMPPEGWLESNVLLWSTDGFPRVANGSSGITPHSQDQTREVTKSFPDAASVDYLRRLGVKSVIWVARFGPGSSYQDVPNRPVDGLGITREQVGEDVVFHLN